MQLSVVGEAALSKAKRNALHSRTSYAVRDGSRRSQHASSVKHRARQQHKYATLVLVHIIRF